MSAFVGAPAGPTFRFAVERRRRDLRPGHGADHGRGQFPSAARDRQGSSWPARRSGQHPEGERRRGRHGSRAALAALGHGHRSVSAVDVPLDAPAVRDRAHEVRADQGRGQAPRRQHQHRVPHRRRRSGIALPRRARRTDARAACIDGDQHPHRRFRRQRLQRGADARPDRGDADRRALRPRRPTSPTRLARHPAPARWRPWPRWRRRCPRR